MAGNFAKVKGPLGTKTLGIKIPAMFTRSEGIKITKTSCKKHSSECGHPIGESRRKAISSGRRY